MLQAYTRTGETFELSTLAPDATIPDSVVWIDMLSPTVEEDQLVEHLVAVEIPTRDDLKDIEPSSRLYVENGAIFMTGSLVWKAHTEFAEVTPVGFVVTGTRLVTVRYAEPKAFTIFCSAAQRTGDFGETGLVVLTKLLETIVDRTAEILESASASADALSAQIFRTDGYNGRGDKRSRDLEEHLGEIAQYQRLTSKTRESLISLSRVLTFLSAMPAIAKDRQLKERCKSVSRDIQSLSDHANFISGNITFLLDASLGLISVEQNSIIKIFSIAAVVLLPPTFVATIYGMNFKYMPELDWTYGYPFSILLMIVISIVPYLWFRWRGWL